MAKIMVGARVPEPWVEKLKAMAETTGLSQTEIIYQAIGNYIGADVSTVSDRFQAIELELEEVNRRLGKLSGLFKV